ncbi:hypothetical protein ACFCXS_10545 [Streptomyces sp. NPDC056373]|uniref:hypothetical protein n=1 Tax=Streptomyces sp. NPDC056373 TaxID=3345798 RepID=UPI0035DD87ED
MTNDALLRPDLTAEDLVLFSGSLNQAALMTGDSHAGQESAAFCASPSTASAAATPHPYESR